MESVKSKIVFITGASAGIGAACAEMFASGGARLILCARRKERLNLLAERLQKEHGTAIHCMQLDVADRSAVAETIKNLPDPWSDVDILVNNAGVGRGLQKLHEYEIDDWEEMINTNVKGLLYVTRALLPSMVNRRSGHIINIGSIAGHEVYPGGSVYCATKHAVTALTRGLQMDVVDTPVRVSTVDPGMVETEFSLVRFKGDRERADKVYEGMTPLTGKDIADCVYYCATRPPHMNINEIIVMPTTQASATVVHREQGH